MDLSLSGKTALVTGAGDGLGRAITLRLAACGASVWACDLNGKQRQQLPRSWGKKRAPKRWMLLTGMLFGLLSAR
jgi:NAD(P)-dependent dehydrogenase (short-subunit alcohol dehydrogenase family)